MEATVESLFTVILHDYPALPEAERTKAEARYVRTLERALGGHEAASHALRLIQALEESDGEVAAEDLATVKRWGIALNAARTAGFQGLGEADGAYFDIRTA